MNHGAAMNQCVGPQGIGPSSNCLTHLCALCCRWEEELSRREQLESTVENMQQVGKNHNEICSTNTHKLFEALSRTI